MNFDVLLNAFATGLSFFAIMNPIANTPIFCLTEKYTVMFPHSDQSLVVSLADYFGVHDQRVIFIQFIGISIALDHRANDRARWLS